MDNLLEKREVQSTRIVLLEVWVVGEIGYQRSVMDLPGMRRYVTAFVWRMGGLGEWGGGRTEESKDFSDRNAKFVKQI